MAEAVVVLKKGEGRTIKAGGAWIFDNEIDTITGSFENGDIVIVHDFDGYMMGRGFINTNSKIRVRMLTRDKEQQIDDEFIRMRVKNAWEYRKSVLLPVDLNCCRVIFGEADFLPGLVIDKYDDVLVVESLALGIDKFKIQIAEYLKELLLADGFTVRGVYERSDAAVRKKEGLAPYKGFIGEEFDTNVVIVENGVHYMVYVVNGQKTGFFLDQKYNRLAIQRLCKDKRVLDCFTHMGTFALNAGIAGAAEVTGLDISDFAVKQALQHPQRGAFRELFGSVPGKAHRKGRRHQLVNAEPPMNSRTSDCSGIHSLSSGVSCSSTLSSIGMPVSGAEAAASFRTVSSKIG